MERPNELLRLFGLLFGLAGALLALPLHSSRVTLQRGGALERLGAGEQKISEADAVGLGRQRMFLGALSGGFFVLLGLLELGIGIGILLRDIAFPWQGRVVLTLHGLFFIFLAPVLFSIWWPAMATACCLCRANVTEAIRKVRDTDPADGDDSKDPQAWLDAVAAPALALREPMDELSKSLGPGVLGASSCVFSAALAWFANAVNAEFCDGFDAMSGAPPGFHRHACLGAAIFATVLALLLAKDPASTSSRCDLLMAELNAAGIRLGPEHHGTIDWLECRLRRLNDGQGIGFRLGHTVVNRKFLTVLGFKLLGSFTSLYAIIISLGDSPAATSAFVAEDVCELSAVQASTIRAVMLDRNASCFYNMTVAAVIDGA